MEEDRELTKAEKKARAKEEAIARKEEARRAKEEAKAAAVTKKADEAAMSKEDRARARAEEKARAKEEAIARKEEAKRAKAEAKAAAKGAPKAPRGRAGEKRIITISIEGTDIRLLIFSGRTVESWDSVAFDPQILKVGQVSDPEGLAEVIRNAMEGRDVLRSQVACALPGLRSVSRVITIPKVSKKELATVVPREVNKLMTLSEEDNVLHWQPLPTETDQMDIFVLAIPREPLTTFLEALRIAELTPTTLDLKPLALARAVNQSDAIIASGESNSMELVIVANDIPVLIRSVFLGEGVVTQDYAVGRISDELGRTILTYNEINKDNPLDPEVPIYLCGSAAGGVPFALNVAALTGRTVQPLEPPIALPEGFPVADFMVNVGLLLKLV
jgi:type IV pilus assembly protein PilM